MTVASSGTGLGLTIALLEHGYRVVANSRRITTAGTLRPSETLALVDGDIAHPDTALKVIETAVQRFGSVDLLVNNAGVFIPKPFTEYTAEDYHLLVSTNLTGLFYITQLVVRHMQEQGNEHSVTLAPCIVQRLRRWIDQLPQHPFDTLIS